MILIEKPGTFGLNKFKLTDNRHVFRCVSSFQFQLLKFKVLKF
jgi:hypothetical protein